MDSADVCNNTWCQDCVPEALPNGTMLDKNAREQLTQFLLSAKDRPLKPAELTSAAAALIQLFLPDKGEE